METIPTALESIDSHISSFNGGPIGGLPVGRITEFRTYPDAEPHRFLAGLLHSMLRDNDIAEAAWLDGMYMLSQNEKLLEDAGVRTGVTIFTPPEDDKDDWFLTVVSGLAGLVDIIVVDGIDMLLEKEQLQIIIPKLGDISSDNDICTIIRTHAWYSPRAGADFTSAGNVLQDYAALGFELFDGDRLRLIYSKIGVAD